MQSLEELLGGKGVKLTFPGNQELLDRGRKIPEEISIAGFDDVPISRIVRPALTTVRQDIQAKGIAAVEELLKLIEGESEDKIVQLGTELVIRDSVKKI